MSSQAGSDFETTLRASINDANVPTLLLLLVQLTGDMTWLEPPFQPTRTKGLSDNDDGGLPPEVQAQVREAAIDAILAWRAGRPVAIPAPTEELMLRMMSVSMGETIPQDYAEMMVDKFVTPDHVADDGGQSAPPPPSFNAVVIGAGMSGICAGIKLAELGVPYTVIEKSSGIGGTWWQNKYPGAGVDTPSHLYSFSFARHDWPHYFATSDEVQEYFSKVAEEFGVRQRVRFETEVLSAVYDESTQLWTTTVRLPDGSQDRLISNIVISAVGAFGRPKWPDIPGRDSFSGASAHTAQWPADLDLTDKRVGVIGNGASAMQLVPAIVDQAQHVTIFQHSPQWAAPFEKFKVEIPEPVRFLFRGIPLYEAWYRLRLSWIFDSKVHPSLQKDPDWPHPERSINSINEGHRSFFSRYITSQLGDRQDLIDAVLPKYPPFGKRMLLDNNWFKTLTRDDVSLVTERVTAIAESGAMTGDGTLHEVDVLVYATGFDVVRFLAPMDIRGKSGRSLRDAWNDDDARSYLGVAVPDFPNFFTLYGPNTQAGQGGSLIFVVESQMRYIADLLRQMFLQNLAAVECRVDVHEDYNSRVDEAHERMVWTHPGMDVYYRNGRGRVVVNSPWRVVDFWKMTRRASLSDFEVKARTSTSRSTS
jgi:4-hydroxyacetophenone monooxygenase